VQHRGRLAGALTALWGKPPSPNPRCARGRGRGQVSGVLVGVGVNSAFLTCAALLGRGARQARCSLISSAQWPVVLLWCCSSFRQRSPPGMQPRGSARAPGHTRLEATRLRDGRGRPIRAAGPRARAVCGRAPAGGAARAGAKPRGRGAPGVPRRVAHPGGRLRQPHRAALVRAVRAAAGLAACAPDPGARPAAAPAGRGGGAGRAASGAAQGPRPLGWGPGSGVYDSAVVGVACLGTVYLRGLCLPLPPPPPAGSSLPTRAPGTTGGGCAPGTLAGHTAAFHQSSCARRRCPALGRTDRTNAPAQGRIEGEVRNNLAAVRAHSERVWALQLSTESAA